MASGHKPSFFGEWRKEISEKEIREAGNGNRESGSGKRESGSGKRKAEGGRWKWKVESGKREGKIRNQELEAERGKRKAGGNGREEADRQGNDTISIISSGKIGINTY
jgi:hypothetical protein